MMLGSPSPTAESVSKCGAGVIVRSSSIKGRRLCREGNSHVLRVARHQRVQYPGKPRASLQPFL